jgi:hypothetical protein
MCELQYIEIECCHYLYTRYNEKYDHASITHTDPLYGTEDIQF